MELSLLIQKFCLSTAMYTSTKEQQLLQENQSLRDEVARLKKEIARLRQIVYELTIMVKRHR